MLWFIQIGDSVSSSRTNLTGVVTANQTTIWELAFQSSTGSFDIQGYTTSLLDNRGTWVQSFLTLSDDRFGPGLQAQFRCLR